MNVQTTNSVHRLKLGLNLWQRGGPRVEGVKKSPTGRLQSREEIRQSDRLPPVQTQLRSREKPRPGRSLTLAVLKAAAGRLRSRF
jgi:hypothetical protein